MIFNNSIITDLNITSVNDLHKLKPFLEDSTLKINKSQIARELDVDRRTVDKYINGYQKPTTRASTDCISAHYDTFLRNYNTYFITIHTLSKNKLNYHSDHYIQIARQSHAFCDEKIEERAKENLEIIGRMYAYE